MINVNHFGLPRYLQLVSFEAQLRMSCTETPEQKELATLNALKRDAEDQARRDILEREAAERKKAVTHATDHIFPKNKRPSRNMPGGIALCKFFLKVAFEVVTASPATVHSLDVDIGTNEGS